MNYIKLHGDLLNQPVEVIVNSWNRNMIPWWLLWPQGVSGAIKKCAGYGPFIELGRMGAIPRGGAVITKAGRLPYKAIIHVAGIDLLWRSSRCSVRDCVLSAMHLVNTYQFSSVAFPVIGAGSGGVWGCGFQEALATMEEAFAQVNSLSEVRIVIFKK